MTFTNKAAEEMRQRVNSLLSDATALEDARRFDVSFFLCSSRCGAMAAPLGEIRQGFTRRFTIYDDDDQMAMLKSIYKQLGLDEKFMQYRAALSRISHAKSNNETPARLVRGRDRSQTDPPAPRFTNSTKSACAKLTPSISTICCSNRCACCATTMPTRERI